jgi:dTDP-4-amino-4,6-dideoxygalactose transaminase
MACALSKTARSLGAEYKGHKVGTIGDIGTFSFFANKVITTGEGGMVTTGNVELYRMMHLLRITACQGKSGTGIKSRDSIIALPICRRP